ncbi:MAG TPA: hypothetical protein VMU27_02830 [Candidatus Paceibacterota bacterium]|nr:hypothetical protein [Candidatus Paceibacterota bacterium]
MTNQEKYRTDYLSNTFEYNDAFDKLFSSAYVRAKKLQAKFFDEIFNYFQTHDSSIQKSDVLFWDDDTENIEGARSYGFESRQFQDTEQYLAEMKNLE